MKSLLILFVSIISLTSYSQEDLDKMIIGKWYTCAYPVSPNQIEFKLFQREPNTCSQDEFESQSEFFWELKSDGSFRYSDASIANYQKSNYNKIVDGIIVKHHGDNGWEVNKGHLLIGDQKFIINVLNERFLLISRDEVDE